MKEKFEKFNELRKSYQKQKKELLYQFFANPVLETSEKLFESQEQFQKDFQEFSKELPETFQFKIADDDSIFIFCNLIEDILNPVETFENVAKRSEWVRGFKLH